MYTQDPISASMMMSYSMLTPVDYQDVFFQDLRDSTEFLVRNSLFLYVAYEIKAVEAAKFRQDPKAEVPFLAREAEIRKMEIPALVELVEKKALAFRAVIREMELLRIEFNMTYAELKDLAERVKLRDEYLEKVQKVTESLKGL